MHIIYKKEGPLVSAYYKGRQLGQVKSLSWVKSFFGGRHITCEGGRTVTLKRCDLSQIALEAYPLRAKVNAMMDKLYPNGYGTPIPSDPKIELLSEKGGQGPVWQLAFSLSSPNQAAIELEQFLCPTNTERNKSQTRLNYMSSSISYSSRKGRKKNIQLEFVEHYIKAGKENFPSEASPFALFPFDLSAPFYGQFAKARAFIEKTACPGNEGHKERIAIVGTNLDKLLGDEEAKARLEGVKKFAEDNDCSFCAVSTEANWGVENVLPITLLTTNESFARKL